MMLEMCSTRCVNLFMASILRVALRYPPFLQQYRCVNVHALYNDVVKYGIIKTHSHEHTQSLAEELLVCIWYHLLGLI